MALSEEDWRELDATAADGLESHPWIPEIRLAWPHQALGTGKAPCETLKRYEVRWADLGPVQGAEMAKKRPVVIVRLDILNEQLQIVTICPLTTSIHPAWCSRQQVRIGRRNAEIAVDQIRIICKSRLGAKLGVLSRDEATVLRRTITEMYGE